MFLRVKEVLSSSCLVLNFGRGLCGVCSDKTNQSILTSLERFPAQVPRHL